MEPLPYIDEHSRRIDAPGDAVWSALVAMLARQLGGSAAFARVLGCDPVEVSPGFAARPGESVPGFRVAAAEPGRRLELRGRHRFADYQLTFEIADGELRARTHAAFPGVLGKLYRAGVIASGAHRVATRRMLRQVAHGVAR